MKKAIGGLVLLFLVITLLSSTKLEEPVAYVSAYKARITDFYSQQQNLLHLVQNSNDLSTENVDAIRKGIHDARLKMKELDFWMRYLDPIVYKQINGPLPVEWETEVFEKFEAPYKRDGAGLTLAENYLGEENPDKDSLARLIEASLVATNIFLEDSITRNLGTFHHFYLANRLYLLNLAAIYSTGFECPDPERVLPELKQMLISVRDLYITFDNNFPRHTIKADYRNLYDSLIHFVDSQPTDPAAFDHFNFIRDFINPLYTLNHKMILEYGVRSTSFNDYSLNKFANNLFDKTLYRGQNFKGVFIGITDETQLAELRETGKLLFFDPILSGNNKRSCASCHKPGEMFADTSSARNLAFDQVQLLSRNTPSLVNSIHNHLLMHDGKHISLENQALDVITNPDEMGGNEKEVLQKILSCDDYRKVFKKYLEATPHFKTVNMEHIASALMLYYGSFSNYYSPFDRAMHEKKDIPEDAKQGFNLFMSKAECATCHFVPQFNGVKPPYVGSEFEVLGVPSDTSFSSLSSDPGRYKINPAKETRSAFRTGSVRNAARTMPYMHNGIFKTLEQVIEFYNNGGGSGRGLHVPNQTLNPDSLKLNHTEKNRILAFIKFLDEDIPNELPPATLPASRIKELNSRKVGGEY